jgi:uncharacterized protein (TIGR02996 family)
MVEDQALLRAARAAPDDDTPRLIYADWLEERADPRGEFIRLQCTLAKMSPRDPRFRELEAREGQLRAQLTRQLIGPKEQSALDLWFSRGLLENVTAPGDEGIREFLARAPGLFRVGLESLSLMPNATGTGRNRTALPLGVATVQALAQSPWLEHLRKLHAPALDAEGLQVLAASPHISQLTHLCASGIGTAGVQALAASPYLTRLRSLNLSGNQLELAGLQALLESPSLAQVTALKLCGFHWEDWNGTVVELRPVIGPEGSRALAGSAHAERLRKLDLSWNGIDYGGAEALAQSPHLADLDKLFLEDSELGDAARQQLQGRFGDRVSFQISVDTYL